MDREKVKVIVPIYTARLTGYEEQSFRHNLRLLGRYPTSLLAPEGLDTQWYEQVAAGVEIRRVSEEWLGRQGIDGYNRMMLSREFYEMFRDCRYILICQTDAWIFRDELEQWCNAGYDYVAAPWPKRKIYDRPIVKQWLWLRRKLCDTSRRIIRQQGFNKVGNGGLSLRRVEAFIEGCDEYADLIEEFKRHSGTLYNEDWFWSIIPERMIYPTLEVALRFSFDIRPEMCYQLAHHRLPFGCHGWCKRRHIGFWQPIIEGNDLAYSATGAAASAGEAAASAGNSIK